MKKTAVLFIPILILAAACVSQISREDLALEYYSLGNAYFDLGKYDKSRDYYLRALELDESLSGVNYNLARIYIETQNYTDAVAVLNNLLVRDPENGIVLKTLAYAEFRAGNPEKALSIYNNYLGTVENDCEVLFNIALIHRETDDKEKAIEVFKQVNEQCPDLKKTDLHLGVLLLEAGDIQEGVVYLEEYVKQDKVEQGTLFLLAEAYEDIEYYSKALEVYRKLLQEEQTRGKAAFRTAVIYLTAAEEPEPGLENLETAINSGFRDLEAIKELLARDDLTAREEVAALLDEYDLYQPDGEEEAVEEENVPDEESEEETPLEDSNSR
ncbi:MAG: tetratricopeptide repeat protein [Spirochaetia bacterium]